MTAKAAEKKKEEAVRALTRGLEILRFVNAEGETRPGEISKSLGIPRPTVYRLLETLESAGYVAFSATSSVVRVTKLAASLGDGFQHGSALSQAAGPLLSELGARTIWPLDISVYDNAAMVIQETTHARSPLSVDRAMSGARIPVLRTSAGRAYLAFCGEEERRTILEHLRRLNDPEDWIYIEPLQLQRMLDETRARGVAVRDAGEFKPLTSSIAAPILKNDCVLGCISLIWVRTAMQTENALETFGAHLRDVATKIADAV